MPKIIGVIRAFCNAKPHLEQAKPCPLSTTSNQRQIISLCGGEGAIKSNTDNVGTDVFLSVQKHSKSIISWIKIVSIRCRSRKRTRAVAKADHMCSSFSHIVHSETTCEHVAHWSFLCRWWHAIYMQRGSSHGSPYICFPWCSAVTVGISVEPIQIHSKVFGTDVHG